MNILFVVENRNSPNYLCIHAVANACQKRGHNVCVLSQGYEKKEFYSQNKRIKEYSVRPDLATNILNRFTRIKLKKIGVCIFKFLVLITTLIWPIRAPLYIRHLSRRTNQIISNEKIDIVVLTHISVENLLVANKKIPNVKYVGYFLDLLVGGMKLSYMSKGFSERKARTMEESIMRNLDYAIMMESSRRIYETNIDHSKYSEKIVFLDLPMLSRIDDKQRNSPKTIFSVKDIVLLFVGSMANNIRDPHYILELFSKISVPNVKFFIVGNSDYCDVISEYSSIDSRIVYVGRKSHEESLNMIREADFLVNIGNNLQNMVPSKIFEYMSYKKPIISTYKVNHDPCIKPLEQYGMFLAIDERVEINVNVNIIEEYIIKNKDAMVEDSYIEQLISKGGALYNNTPEAFADFIDLIKQEV